MEKINALVKTFYFLNHYMLCDLLICVSIAFGLDRIWNQWNLDSILCFAATYIKIF